MRESKNIGKFTVLRLAALLVLMALSILVVSPMASNPESYKGTIAKLEEKQNTVMKVTASATVTSVTVAAIPDDATTPVANKIMDLVGYLVVVLCAIVLEKYLLAIIGYTVFHWLIPGACFLTGINIFARNRTITSTVAKLLALSVSLMLVVPVSLQVSDMIEQTSAVTMEITGEELEELALPAESEAVVPETEAAETEEAAEEESQGGWFSNILNAVTDKISETQDAASQMMEEAKDKVTNLATMTITKAQTALNQLIEIVVVLVVTNCLIPVLVLVLLIWIMKLILGIQLDIPEHRGREHGFSHRRDGVEE